MGSTSTPPLCYLCKSTSLTTYVCYLLATFLFMSEKPLIIIQINSKCPCGISQGGIRTVVLLCLTGFLERFILLVNWVIEEMFAGSYDLIDAIDQMEERLFCWPAWAGAGASPSAQSNRGISDKWNLSLYTLRNCTVRNKGRRQNFN